MSLNMPPIEANSPPQTARVVVVGATGNVGTSVVQALADDPSVTSILGVARRLPQWSAPRTEWVQADIERDDLVDLFRGADVVIHLAWLIQPTHSPLITWRTNVEGSNRVFQAVAKAGVPALVYASSVGAYSPGPKDKPVDEQWPTDGWPTASYTREKAYLERSLDAFERAHRTFVWCGFARVSSSNGVGQPATPVRRRTAVAAPAGAVGPGAVRARPAGSAVPSSAHRRCRPGLPVGRAGQRARRFQHRCRTRGRRGHAGRVSRCPYRASPGLAGAYRAVAGLAPTPGSRFPYLFDIFLRLPIMDTTRARTELGWSPRYSSRAAIEELLGGMRDGAGMSTPPLAPTTPGGRIHELRTGVGSRP